MVSLRITALLLALAVSGTAFSDYADPPGRVGRLSYLQGQVSLQPSDAGAPEQAELNRPLTIGDRLLTESGSRAELSVGTAAIRLDERTDLTIANLDHDIAQLELNSGTLGIHLRELGEAETFEIDTPNATVLLLHPGDYRIEVDPQGATLLAVRTGEAALDGGSGPVRLRDRQELRFVGDEQLADARPLGPLDAFDQWCIERERAIADAQATRYVSRDVVGYEDLDSYGRWWSEPGYGSVWAPTTVIIGWAPYRFGRWTWISPWGWTWVDHAPWGFAPFHYGRWAFLRHRWCWVPGPRHHRAVWAPALVGWHGSPHGDSLRQGAVSWFPLGPREVHVPLHQASPRYLRNVNISNTTLDNNAQITNAVRNRVRNIRHANRDAPGALSTVPSAAFDARRPAAPPAAFRQAETEPPAADRRMTFPRVPTERRAIQRNGNWTQRQPDVGSHTRAVERPPTALRSTEPRGMRAEPRQWTNANRGQAAAPRQNEPSRAARSQGAGTVHAAGQDQRAEQTPRSSPSTSRAQSARTGWSSNRP